MTTPHAKSVYEKLVAAIPHSVPDVDICIGFNEDASKPTWKVYRALLGKGPDT